MKLTKEQLRTLPEWLRVYDGAAEDGNTPMSYKDWQATQRRYLGAAEPVKEAKLTLNMVTERLLDEVHLWMLEAAQTLPRSALRDRGVALGLVVEEKLQAVRLHNAGKRDNMAKARDARVAPAGAPKIKLRVTDPNGKDTVVNGYDEAAALTGYAPGTIKQRMSYAKRETGYERTTLGRANRAETMWLVTKVHD